LKVGQTNFYKSNKTDPSQNSDDTGMDFYLELKFVPICQTLANRNEMLSLAEFYKISLSDSDYKSMHDLIAHRCRKYSSKAFNVADDSIEFAIACEYIQ
jgi:hypothetical protein